MEPAFISRFILLCLALLLPRTIHAAQPEVLNLWPGDAPGEAVKLPPEGDVSKASDRPVAGKPVLRLGNISKPTLSIYRPPAEKNCGTAVLVCPGGGYNIVATDLEGTEICEWFNSLGVTAGLLKYRVPRRQGLEKHAAPLQDAQRSMSLLRQRAKELGFDAGRIGVIGFSAGGHLAASLTSSAAQRTYPIADAADTNSCRPNFALLIYPAYFTPTNDLTKLAPEVAVTTNHPPTFMVMTQDDPIHVENVLLYALALKQAHVPNELHTYATGGHGYGLRRTGEPVTRWPELAKEWLSGRGLLSRK
jgi:acetyl esterase/lipase